VQIPGLVTRRECIEVQEAVFYRTMKATEDNDIQDMKRQRDWPTVRDIHRNEEDERKV